MDEYKAVEAVWGIIDPGEILYVQHLWDRAIENEDCVRYLPKKARKNVDYFENFLRSHSTIFSVENGRVLDYDPELLTTRESAIEYFEDILSDYKQCPNYTNFRGHINQAEKNIQDFIRNFYPGNSFKDFLLSCPEVFVVFSDGTINLIENECVNHFENVIKTGENYFNSRGHLGQAPKHVIQYINSEYPGVLFLQFLLNHPDSFEVDSEGCVFLVSESYSE